jgi:large subunit ribosomal protein L9
MKVILYKDIENLGKTGDIIEVKRGFAQNFLIPKGLALEATPQSLKKIEQEKKRREKIKEAEKRAAEELSLKLERISLTIPVETKDDETLYGSVSDSQICKVLEEEGIKIDRKSILLENPIKRIGVYEIPIRLHSEVETKIKVWVVKK